jgi:long-chain acyl-CoA synthetase
MNLAQLLTDAAASTPDGVAVKMDDLEVTYAQLDEESARVAGVLEGKGVVPGDRVGIMLPNVPYFAFVYYGVLRAGAVVVPMNPLLKEREVAFYLGDPEAKLLFAWHQFADAAHAGADTTGAECILVEPGNFESLIGRADPRRDVVARAGDDTAVILYTSGTTGSPKGAELTHGNLRSNTEAARELLSASGATVALGALPLFHAFGQTCALNLTMRVGGCLTLLPRFDAGRALEIIERDRVTLFEGVPTMFSAMIAHEGEVDASTLELCVSGGAAMPVDVMRRFEERFGCIVLEGYGLSETSPIASFSRADRVRKPGSIGLPIHGVEMKVVADNGAEVSQGEVGEIAIRGHNVMKGYWQLPQATAEAIDPAGWFKTGDLGHVDEDGYFFIVDRKKEMIIRGGFNVYPREIEEVLYEHPAVREAAVIGRPHESLGEEVAAAVSLKARSNVTAEDLRQYVKERVAAYKYPRQVWVLDELPKGPTGKIQKRDLKLPTTTREGT